MLPISPEALPTHPVPCSQAPGYNCPRSCRTPNCFCASHEIPGGLKPKDAPQFVVLVRWPNDSAAGWAVCTWQCPPFEAASVVFSWWLQTNDDAITVTTMPVILDITSKHKNPNNCDIPAT